MITFGASLRRRLGSQMWRMSEFTREIKRRRCVEDKPCVDLKHFL
jgi:hypothetical protein